MILCNRSFSRGLLSKYLYARPDIEDYPFGARELVNFKIGKEGAPETRGGFEFIDECRSPGTEKRLIQFIFSTSTADTYVIEAGNEYMEFVRAGSRILESEFTITAATAASPCVITTSAVHGMTAGDHIYIEDVVGMTELNGRRYLVGTPSTTTLSLQDVHGANVDSTAFTAYSSGGTAARVYKIATTYQEADLQKLKFTQSADVMYIVHPSYTRRKLSRTGHTAWTLTEAPEGPVMDGPAAVLVTTGGSGAGLIFKYKVTAIPSTGTESLPGYEAAIAISGATAANPVVITSATHSYSDGDEVKLTGILGMTELNNRRFIVRVTGYSSTTFALVNVNGTSYTAYTSAGNAYRTHDVITNANEPTAAAPHVITWSAVVDAAKYAIYRERYGFYGFVGYSTSLSFSDPGVTPDTAQGPPEYSEEFFGGDNQPGAVTIHQQRVVYGGSNEEPDTLKTSAIAGFDDFSSHNPQVDTDPVEIILSSQEVNQIVHLVSLRRLIALTGASEWAVLGDDGGTITPSKPNARPYTNQGASHVRPAVVDNDILFVQARGNMVRSLYYDFGEDSYVGEDLTVKASGLFRDFSIRDMAYSKIPDSILWVCRSDGRLLGLTYNKAQNIVAWHEHEVGGTDVVVENVCSIPEGDSSDVGGVDAVYAIVKRTVDGRTCRYLERMQDRYVDQDMRGSYPQDAPSYQKEFTYLDSHLTYDGRLDHTVPLSDSPGLGDNVVAMIASGDHVAVSAGVDMFLSTDVGEGDTSRRYFVYDSTGKVIRLTPTTYTDAKHTICLADRDLYAEADGLNYLGIAFAVKRVTGLNHLEGESVTALGDGFVASNSLTATTPVVVADGIAVFDDYYSVLHVGLSYIQDLGLLDVEFPEAQSWYGVRKKVDGVGVYVKDSATFLAGIEFPDSDEDVNEGLSEAAAIVQDEQDPDVPVPLRTELIEVTLDPVWTEHGRAVIRNIEPLPLTILAVTRVMEVSQNGV